MKEYAQCSAVWQEGKFPNYLHLSGNSVKCISCKSHYDH